MRHGLEVAHKSSSNSTVGKVYSRGKPVTSDFSPGETKILEELLNISDAYAVTDTRVQELMKQNKDLKNSVIKVQQDIRLLAELGGGMTDHVSRYVTSSQQMPLGVENSINKAMERQLSPPAMLERHVSPPMMDPKPPPCTSSSRRNLFIQELSAATPQLEEQQQQQQEQQQQQQLVELPAAALNSPPDKAAQAVSFAAPEAVQAPGASSSSHPSVPPPEQAKKAAEVDHWEEYLRLEKSHTSRMTIFSPPLQDDSSVSANSSWSAPPDDIDDGPDHWGSDSN